MTQFEEVHELVTMVMLQKPVHDLRLLHRGTDLVFVSDAENRVFKVRSCADFDEVFEVMNDTSLITQLARSGAPVLPPVGLAFKGLDVITAWERGDTVSSEHVATLGTTLRQLHATDVTIDFPKIDISQRLENRLRNLSFLDEEVHNMIGAKVETALKVFDTFMSGNERVHTLIHGDAHMGNIITLHGEPKLIDLDKVAYGEPLFDVLPQYVAYQRMHRDTQRWESFKMSYDADRDWVATEQVLDGLRVIRETTMNTWDADVMSHEPWSAM